MSDEEIVPVIFRIWKDGSGAIALFPTIEAERGHCLSFMHVGQHGAADYQGVMAATRRDRCYREAAEFAALKAELERDPYFYKLRVYKRKPRQRHSV